MTPPRPQINLDITTMWCSRHLAPFRPQWPRGLPIAMIELFERAAAMQAVIDIAHDDANHLAAALGRFKPVCCFVADEDLAAVYAKAGVSPPPG